jgi:RNA polymerase sigma-70 factor (ECF subfamily)
MTWQIPSDRTDCGRAQREDAEIITALCAGDTEVLGEVYVAHKKAVLAVITRLVVERSFAEDLAQETFLLLPSALKGFRGGCSLRTFIISIAVNLARHQVRNTIRRRQSMVRYAQLPEMRFVVSPEQSFAHRQLGAAIVRALDRLSPEKRETFLLREYHEHSSLETAELVSAPEATVRTRVHHARKTLRAALVHEGYESAA